MNYIKIQIYKNLYDLNIEFKIKRQKKQKKLNLLLKKNICCVKSTKFILQKIIRVNTCKKFNIPYLLFKNIINTNITIANYTYCIIYNTLQSLLFLIAKR